MTDGLVDTKTAARMLEVPANVIASWRRRKKVTPVVELRGQGRKGRAPLYRLDELRVLAARYHDQATRQPPSEEE